MHVSQYNTVTSKWPGVGEEKGRRKMKLREEKEERDASSGGDKSWSEESEMR